MKNFTFRQINHSHYPEKWYIKVPIIASKCEKRTFATESDYVKGVLFGNAYRLIEIEKRDEFFTTKCITSAKRDKIALVKTPDLFFVVRYLQENDDLCYAELCRKAILETEGKTVAFPKHN